MKLKQIHMAYLGVAATMVALFGVTYAAFADKGEVLGSSFSVGSADIKILDDLGLGFDQGNLVDEKPGPNFEGISPNWTEDYLIKLYNNASTPILLSSSADYETANDPSDLRQDIYVEPFEWDDANADGILDSGELGSSLGRKTIVKWKTEGFDLGQLDGGTGLGLVLRFSTDALSDSKQGAVAVFDFVFDSVGLE